MASYDIRDAASACDIIRYDASNGDTLLFASLASLRPESVAFVPEGGQVCLETAGTVYLCRGQDTNPLPVAKISAGTPGGFACLVDGVTCRFARPAASQPLQPIWAVWSPLC